MGLTLNHMSSSRPFPAHFIRSFVYTIILHFNVAAIFGAPPRKRMTVWFVWQNAGASDISCNAHAMYPAVEFTDWYLFPHAGEGDGKREKHEHARKQQAITLVSATRGRWENCCWKPGRQFKTQKHVKQIQTCNRSTVRVSAWLFTRSLLGKRAALFCWL